MRDDVAQLKQKPRCFCQIPLTDLEKWAHKKYVDGKNTIDLLAETRSDYDKELVTIIAMLDVEKEKLDTMLGHAARSTCNLDMCRHKVREWLLHILDERQK